MSAENAWNEKLYSCTDDWATCCYGCWCTPCLFGSNSKEVDDKNCVLMCCLYGILANCYLCWIPHLFEREHLRKKYNLKEEPCGDCPTTLCCGPCALCQEAREMKGRANKGGVVFQANKEGVVSQANNSAPIVAQPKRNSDPDRTRV